MGASAVPPSPAHHGLAGIPFGLFRFGAAAAVLGGTTLLPFAGIASTSRSLFGGVQSAVRLGLVNSPVRAGGAVLAMALPLGAVFLIGLLLTGHRVLSRLLADVLAPVGLVTSAFAVLASDTPRLGALVTAFGSLFLLAARRFGRSVAASPVDPPGQNRGRAVLVVAGCGVVAVSGLLLFGVGLRGGASSSTRAAAHFAEALRAGDNLAVLEQLDPVERRALVEQGPKLLSELRRLGVVKRSVTVGGTGVRGGKVELGNEIFLADGLSSVQISGTLSVPTVLVRPLGANVADTIRQPGQLVSVRRKGRWYVSILHTAADVRRVEFGRQFPGLDVEPVGAPNPEAAVRQMLTAFAAVDLPGLISVLDPDEASVAYRYGSVLQDDVNRLAAWSLTNARWTFPDMGLSSTVSGSRAEVRVTRLSAQLDLPSDFGVGSSAVLNGDCVRVTVELESSRHCGAAIPQVIADLFGTTAPDLGDLGWLSNPQDLGKIVVVQRDGRWYVAPLRSVAATTTLRLRTYDPADLTGIGNDLPSRIRRFADNPLVRLATGW